MLGGLHDRLTPSGCTRRCLGRSLQHDATSGVMVLAAAGLQEALDAFDTAIAANPQSTLVWLHKAETLQTLERIEAARTAYEQVWSQSPVSQPFHVEVQQHLQPMYQRLTA
ncbi:MAG: hypothetical protein O7G88_05110 [bacterium]|nr:hypothetical protein [bacterium]